MESKDVSKKYLMLLAIGPVQEFIAQARKTRDLWFGSYLLSELSKKAAKVLTEQGGDLVYPYVKDTALNTSSMDENFHSLKVVNKVLAIVQTDDPKKLALQVREAVEQLWRTYANKTLEELRPYINVGAWDRQVKDVIEFNAVWSVLNNENSYKDVLAKTERLLDARKTLRDFKQNEPGQLFGEAKSSLDSGRESVLYADRWPEYARYGIKRRETLDAISLVKRLSNRLDKTSKTQNIGITGYQNNAKEFPSVCDTAFAYFRSELEPHASAKAYINQYFLKINEWLGKEQLPAYLKAQDYDSRLFYNNRLIEYVEEVTASTLMSEQEQRRIAFNMSTLLDELYAKLKTEFNLNQPTSYYAFMMCDGDHMGRARKLLLTAEQHLKFSKGLSEFASEAQEIIRQNKGVLVYSGGDDVMAYVPLQHFLEASDKLRMAFIKSMKVVVPGEATPTLSVGIAIVHMRELLGDVRALAISAEKLAKKERDSLAIIFQKRSGGDLMQMNVPFRDHPICTMKKLQRYYKEGLYSVKFAYELRSLHEEYRRMRVSSSWLTQTEELNKILTLEIKRLAFKKKPETIEKQDIESRLLPLLYGILNSGQNLAKYDALEQLRQLAEQTIMATMLMKEGGIEDEEAVANSTC